MFRVITGDGSGGERGKPERRLRLVGERERSGGDERKKRAAPPPRPGGPTYDDAA